MQRVAIALFAALHLLALAWLLMRPDWAPGGQVAAVLPPATSAAAAMAMVAAADGRIVRVGAGAAILVLTSDRPDFPARLLAAGAWAVLSPVVAGGCLGRSGGATTTFGRPA